MEGEPVQVFDDSESESVVPHGLGTGRLIQADARTGLASLDDEIVQTVVTSPPYWGLRDYGIHGQIGAEPTIDEFVDNLVKVFADVRRVLRPDGTFWLNIGDAFTSGGRTWRHADKKLRARGMDHRPATPAGLKPKDLIGVPWRLAFALQADGWYLRTDIVWNKPNGNPESVKDRPVRMHEFVFLLTKSETYLYNHQAVKQPTLDGKGSKALRSVWNINTEPFPDAHFACFPTALVEPCILAGTNEGDTVLDPFFGSGTVGQVARALGRDFIGLELNPEYVAIAQKRLQDRSQYDLPITRLQ
jgi:site-specific DNA-methyltransferase (adenine-specific)/site-specific DNA-methyltransferase (cytosine-N4-specific)